MAEEIWVIALGAGPEWAPYLSGKHRPVALSVDRAEIFPSREAAQAAINSASKNWREIWPEATPVQVSKFEETN